MKPTRIAHLALSITLVFLLRTSFPVFASAPIVYDGPILDNPGDWDGYAVHLVVDGVHHMWWCSQIQHGTYLDSIWHSQKTTALSLTSGWSTPTKVLDHTQIAWTDSLVCDPTVVLGHFSFGGNPYRFAMYFTALQNGSTENNAVGVAFSNNGTSWTARASEVILPDNPFDGSYGAGESSAAWGPSPGVLNQVFSDTTYTGVPQQVRLKTSTDGISFSPTPSTSTLISLVGVGPAAAAPEITYFAPDRTWYLSTHNLSGGDPSGLTRFSRSDTPDSLTSTWSSVAALGFDDPITGEELQILPSLARNANSTLYVDSDGWAYAFLTVGDQPPNGGVLTWRIAQARIRVLGAGPEVVGDSFAGVGQNRRNSDPLSQVDADVGARRWNANPELKFNDGKIVSSTSGGQPIADLPFSASSHPQDSEIRISSTFDISGLGWYGVGFSSTTLQGLFGGQLGILVNRLTSSLEIWISGAGTRVSLQAIPNLTATRNRLDVFYNKSANTVRVQVNGQEPVAGALVDLDTYSFTPTINFAYFQMFNPTAGQSSVEDFWVNGAVIFRDDFERGNSLSWITCATTSPTCIDDGPPIPDPLMD